MHPQTINCELRVAVEFVENVDALDDLTYIPHVEDVVRFSRGGEEAICD